MQLTDLSSKGDSISHSSPLSHFRKWVFDRNAQERYLSKALCQHLEEVRNAKIRFDTAFADEIAKGLHGWASFFGATHFTHWFQPLTHATAEKHDSFLGWGAEGSVLECFQGSDLLFGVADASSLPHGGLRATHEARGYSAWDPTSFPFLWESADRFTLCLPAVFYSWTGVALDHKIPLLRSDQKMEHQVKRLLSICKIKASYVYSTLGIEQEYFLIDREMYAHRPDLLFAGRTVYGAKPPKGQELEDHYFGALSDRVMSFMCDFEERALRVGIPVKTRHHEVAPSQYEVAPLFERGALACDHNLLLMQVMRQSAAKYGLACLFHEKPFAGINGSGKHNNWSIATDTGLNLLNPKENSLVFLSLLTAILHGIYKHAGLLRASIASPGNDHRLGGSEAPPSIPSVFLGSALEQIIHEMIQEKPLSPETLRHIDLGLSHLPPQIADATDRNRTSFFAFTGNKFEFRAVGASASCAFPMAILNAIVADSLSLLVDELESVIGDSSDAPEEQIFAMSLPVLRKMLKASLGVLFGGNSYSHAWHQEAKTRGLPDIPCGFQALEMFRDPASIRVLENVLTEPEIESRFEIWVEQYAKTMGVETHLMLELLHTKMVPAIERDLQRKMSCLDGLVRLGMDATKQKQSVETINALLNEALQVAEEIQTLETQSLDFGWEAKAKVFCELIAGKMQQLRKAVDTLELLVDYDLWPLPKYQELLFQG